MEFPHRSGSFPSVEKLRPLNEPRWSFRCSNRLKAEAHELIARLFFAGIRIENVSKKLQSSSCVVAADGSLIIFLDFLGR
jgi:hypothetical protein